MLSQSGQLNHLFVLEEHRRKGLGQIVELDLAKKAIRYDNPYTFHEIRSPTPIVECRARTVSVDGADSFADLSAGKRRSCMRSFAVVENNFSYVQCFFRLIQWNYDEKTPVTAKRSGHSSPREQLWSAARWRCS